MRKLSSLAILAASIAPAAAGTLNVQASGFTELPAAVTNQFTTYSDADFQRTLNWGKVAFNPWIQQTYNPTNNPAFVPTNTQIWNAIVHNWIQGIITAEQQFSTTPAQPPTPIVIGP
jgi:hypothetical protein